MSRLQDFPQPSLSIDRINIAQTGPFWNFWGLDRGQNEKVTDVTTDKLGFGKGDPETLGYKMEDSEHILRPTPTITL